MRLEDIVVRRSDYLFLAMIAFAAAVASAPPAPRVARLAEPELWSTHDNDRMALGEFDLGGTSVLP